MSPHTTDNAVSVRHGIDIDRELKKGFAVRFIRHKVKQLIHRAGFTETDRYDLEQEMKLRVWLRFPKFDPAKATWQAFVTTIVERHVATILQKARRLKRREGEPPVSLSELEEDFDNELVELSETIGPQHRENVTGRWVDGFENQVDLNISVEELLARMPARLRRLCELLKTYNVEECARRLRVHRCTVFKMLGQVRQTFIYAGFENFLPYGAARDGETR